MASYYKKLTKFILDEARMKPWERSWLRLGRTNTKGETGAPYRTAHQTADELKILDPSYIAIKSEGGHSSNIKPEMPRRPSNSARLKKEGNIAARNVLATSLKRKRAEIRKERADWDSASEKYSLLTKKFVEPLKRLERKRYSRQRAQEKITGGPKPPRELSPEDTKKVAQYNAEKADYEKKVEPAISGTRTTLAGITPSAAEQKQMSKIDVSKEPAAKEPKLPAESLKAPEPPAVGLEPRKATPAPFVQEPFKADNKGNATRIVRLPKTERVTIVTTNAERKAAKDAIENAFVAARKRMAGPTSASVSNKPMTGPVQTEREFEPNVVQQNLRRGWAHKDTKVSSRPVSVPGTHERTPALSATGTGTTPGTFTVERPVKNPEAGEEGIKITKKATPSLLRKSTRFAHERVGGEGPVHARKVRHVTAPKRYVAVPGMGSAEENPERRRLKLSPAERRAINTRTEETITNFSTFLGQYLTEHRYD